MPASARGARMPPGNRFSTSESLNSHSVWKSSIGYDPYSNSKDRKVTDAEAAAVRGRENDFAEFKGLTKLLSARGAGQSSEGARVCGLEGGAFSSFVGADGADDGGAAAEARGGGGRGRRSTQQHHPARRRRFSTREEGARPGARRI